MDSAVSSPPRILHPRSHRGTQHQQNEQVHTTNYIALIILPIMAAFVLLCGLLLLLILRRSKEKIIRGCSSISGSFRKRSFDETRQFSKCLSNVNLSDFGYNPDVGKCIYGGKLSFAPPVKNKGGQVFTYKELEMATDGFHERNVIGRGGLDVVYKGILVNGTAAAVKLLHVEGKHREREFRMEVDLLSRLHSHYLVGFLGYCADQHHRLLAFEYMPNGSLQQHLHPPPSQSGKPFRALGWKTRLRIALDCARGLEFLHERSVPAIIHRDFKCCNIFLDHNFDAKVSDFGMAKTVSDKVNSQVHTRLLGTTGYVAPEYASTGRLSTKSDVYSYGVVLLELLTGRVPVDTSRPQEEHVLVSWALPRLTNREKVVQMVDPALQGQYSKKELIQVAAIAAVCVQSEAHYRPLITDVVQSLIPLVRNARSTCLTPARANSVKVSMML